jgi:predicted amidohydrolase YtcJ
MAKRTRRSLLAVLCLTTLAALTAILGTGAVAASPPAADTIYINGNIYTVNANFDRAQAMAIRGDRFLAVGANEAMDDYICPNTAIIDLKGKTIFPGLWDGHIHFESWGSSLYSLDLSGMSKAQVVAAVAGAVANALPGQWITGNGWNQTLWDPPVFPTAADLDAVSPNNPVRLSRTDGHATWVNSYVLTLSGIDKNTPDVTGGLIIRYPDGTPTGVFTDATPPGLKSAPAKTDAQTRQCDLTGQAALFALGDTSGGFMSASQTAIERLRDMYSKGQMKFRNYCYVSVGSSANYYYPIPRNQRVGLFGDRLTINGVKLVADGALGSAGAWMMQPYSDNAAMGRDPNWCG